MRDGNGGSHVKEGKIIMLDTAETLSSPLGFLAVLTGIFWTCPAQPHSSTPSLPPADSSGSSEEGQTRPSWRSQSIESTPECSLGWTKGCTRGGFHIFNRSTLFKLKIFYQKSISWRHKVKKDHIISNLIKQTRTATATSGGKKNISS